MPRRRGLVQYAAAWMAAGSARASGPVAVSASAKAGAGRFVADEFAMVGVFGLDWLLEARFTRMLDHIAASPGAVRAVRVFGSLSLGRDRTFPTRSEEHTSELQS